MAEARALSDALEEFNGVTSRPEIFLSSNKEVASKLQKWTKVTYDILKSADTLESEEALPELLVDGFDDEQIWQEIELQNAPAIDAILKDISSLKVTTLSFHGGLDNEYEQASEDDGMEDVQEEDENEGYDLSEDDEYPLGLSEDTPDLKLGDESGSESEEEKELKKLLDAAAARDKDEGENESEEDEEEDLFGDLEKEEETSKKKKGKPVGADKEMPSTSGEGKKQVNKRKTVVDDRFFSIADLETFLDREDAREEKLRRKEEAGGEANESDSDDEEDDEEEEGTDFFADIPSDDEGASSRMLKYKDFFDPPNEDGTAPKSKVPQTESGEESEDGEMEESDEGEEDGPIRKDLFDDEGEEEGEESVARSTFEKRQERLAKRIKGLEGDNLAPKAWQLGGEVTGATRPENSLLQEDLDFELQSRLAPEITEETTKSLEDIIKQRIKDQSWDDVERKVKPTDTPFEYKKKVVLDMEKSKKSLAEMYEEEYLKQAETEKEEKEDPDHKEIKQMMTSLFLKLDALSNYHFTPKPAAAEIKVVSNLPSVTVEEVAPVSVSEAAMLAPEEVKDKQQRELKGDTEKTKEDKSSERRLKKQQQRKRKSEKEKRKKLIEKLNPGLGNKYAKQNALDDLEKQSKGTRANVTIIKDKSGKSDLTSSSKFFSKLQDQMSSRIKANKAGEDKKKKKAQKSSSKFML